MATHYQRMCETDPEGFEKLKQTNREHARRWREANPEYAKRYMKTYMSEYRKDERKCEKIRATSRAWYRKNYKQAMYNNAKRRAEKYNIEFSIDLDEFEIPERCPIYGLPLEISNRGYGSPNSPSLDRIDPRRGYVPGNVHVISYRANTHKSDALLQEILLLAEWAKQNML